MEKYFHIETIDQERLLVIILSCELTSVYWNELVSSLRKRRCRNKIVYFDFLYRNGYENRFFIAKIDDQSNFREHLKRCEVNDAFDAISHRFFSLHRELLFTSILSRRQIEQYLQRK